MFRCPFVRQQTKEQMKVRLHETLRRPLRSHTDVFVTGVLMRRKVGPVPRALYKVLEQTYVVNAVGMNTVRSVSRVPRLVPI